MYEIFEYYLDENISVYHIEIDGNEDNVIIFDGGVHNVVKKEKIEVPNCILTIIDDIFSNKEVKNRHLKFSFLYSFGFDIVSLFRLNNKMKNRLDVIDLRVSFNLLRCRFLVLHNMCFPDDDCIKMIDSGVIDVITNTINRNRGDG